MDDVTIGTDFTCPQKLHHDILMIANTGYSMGLICLCEVFAAHQTNLAGYRGQFAEYMCRQLNEYVDMSEWTWYSDMHLLTFVNTRLVRVQHYELMSAGVTSQPMRKLQHFVLVANDGSREFNVFNNHSMSSSKHRLSPYMKNKLPVHLYRHTRGNRPIVLMGGDFNANPLEWALALAEIRAVDSDANDKLIQSGVHFPWPGDDALVLNCNAQQVGIAVGETFGGFSDCHDVVAVKLYVPGDCAVGSSRDVPVQQFPPVAKQLPSQRIPPPPIPDDVSKCMANTRSNDNLKRPLKLEAPLGQRQEGHRSA